MNILKIRHNIEDPFLDHILAMNALNEFVLERNFIIIDVMDPDPINFIYRRYFENVFLHRKSLHEVSTHSRMDSKEYTIRISVGEAINIIKSLAPPVFQARIHELYSTVDILVDTLEYYLTDIDTGTLEFQINKFRKCIGWNPFETVSSYDKSRMDTIRSKIIPVGESGCALDLYAYKGEFKDIFEGTCPDDVKDPYPGCTPAYGEIQFVFSFDYKRYLYKLIEILDQKPDILISNVFTSDGAKYSCVECYIPEYTFDPLDYPKFYEMLHDTYAKLVGA